jgi:spore coat polysaccharide biosynthesis protein SpsF (cytidylyltransferase family)
LIVATSINPKDDPIAALCEKIELPYFRGDLENVLDRFYQAARQHNP